MGNTSPQTRHSAPEQQTAIVATSNSRPSSMRLKRGDSFYENFVMKRRSKPLNKDVLLELPYVVALNVASFLDFRDHHILRRVNLYWNAFFLTLARKQHEQLMDSLFDSLSSNRYSNFKTPKRRAVSERSLTPTIVIPKRKSLYINNILEIRKDPSGSPVSS
jgi:hypothetical protein